MSIRRAVELNFKNRLETALANSKYKVLESAVLDPKAERPMPCVIVIAGEAKNALDSQPDPLGNYMVDVSIVVMSRVDKETADEHYDASQIVAKTMADIRTRKEAIVEGLYLYETIKLTDGHDSQERKMGSGFNFRCMVNYNP